MRQASLFAKDLDLGLFDPFKDVKDDALLHKEEIVAKEEEVADERRDDAEQGDDVVV